MKTVPLGGKKYPGLVALVDDADYAPVAAHSWCPNRTQRGFYAVTRLRAGDRTIVIRLHSFLTGWRGVDHEDGDGLNNCRANLRRSTQTQNAANSRKWLPATSSNYKGVSFVHRTGRWRAYITVAGRQLPLGAHPSEAAAGRIYDAAALAVFGEFARLNFPDERPVPWLALAAPQRKITAEQAIEIFRRCWSGESDSSLASEFGLRREAVSKIRHGRRWVRVTQADRSAA